MARLQHLLIVINPLRDQYRCKPKLVKSSIVYITSYAHTNNIFSDDIALSELTSHSLTMNFTIWFESIWIAPIRFGTNNTFTQSYSVILLITHYVGICRY